MPFFSQAPSSSLSASLKRAIGGSEGQLDPMQEIEIDAKAASTAQSLAMVDKLRAEVKAKQEEQQMRTDPARAAEYAGNVAGMDRPNSLRLAANLRGDTEQPSVADVEDAAIIGREAAPFRVTAPDVTPGQRNAFQRSLAAIGANLLATGHTNADQLIQGQGRLQEQDITQRVQDAIAGGKVQDASAMNQGGKLGTAIKLFDNVGDTGATYSPSTGAVQADPTAQPGNSLLKGTLDKIKAAIGKDNAAAGASGAHAGLFRAQTDKTRSDMTREEKGQYDSARGILIDPRTGVARDVVGADGKPLGAKDKPLPNPAIEKLSAAGTAVEDTTRLAGTFKPEYGGKTILGDLSNTYKRIAGDETGQAQWWQDMDNLQNQTRHALFGSALTATELAAWNKTSIQPRMNAKQIQENLARRQEIEARAASKLSRAYEAGGYNKQQIEELLGVGAGYLQNPAPPVGSKGASGGWDGKDRRAAGAKPTQADLEYTAKKNGMTVEQVKAQLGIE